MKYIPKYFISFTTSSLLLLRHMLIFSLLLFLDISTALNLVSLNCTWFSFVHFSILARSELADTYVRVCVCVYVCMYVCMYICMDARVYVYTDVCIYICMDARVYVYTDVCIYIWMYLYMYILVCIYICIYLFILCICIYICVLCKYVCMYVCMYVLCIYAYMYVFHKYACTYVFMYVWMDVWMYMCIYLYMLVLHMYVCMWLLQLLHGILQLFNYSSTTQECVFVCRAPYFQSSALLILISTRRAEMCCNSTLWSKRCVLQH